MSKFVDQKVLEYLNTALGNANNAIANLGAPECPVCQAGYLCFSGESLGDPPPQFDFKCTNCEAKAILIVDKKPTTLPIWINVETKLPPEREMVETRTDDDNYRTLQYIGGDWFTDGETVIDTMPVSPAPTQWKPILCECGHSRLSHIHLNSSAQTQETPSWCGALETSYSYCTCQKYSEKKLPYQKHEEKRAEGKEHYPIG